MSDLMELSGEAKVCCQSFFQIITFSNRGLIVLGHVVQTQNTGGSRALVRARTSRGMICDSHCLCGPHQCQTCRKNWHHSVYQYPVIWSWFGRAQTGQLVIGTGSASLLSNTVGGVQIGWSSTISCSEPYRDLRVKLKQILRFSPFFILSNLFCSCSSIHVCTRPLCWRIWKWLHCLVSFLMHVTSCSALGKIVLTHVCRMLLFIITFKNIGTHSLWLYCKTKLKLQATLGDLRKIVGDMHVSE